MTITELRKQEGNRLGFGSIFKPFDGTAAAYSELTGSEQIALTNAMKAYIREHPGEFTAVANQVANTADIPQVEAYSAGAAVSDFFGAVADEAASINDAVNPFSASNRKWVLGVAVVAVAAYFLAPVIIAAVKKAPEVAT